MNFGKAESRSISLPTGIWDLVDRAGGEGGRTKYIRKSVEDRLRADGEIPDAEEFDLLELLREAKALKVPVRDLLASEIEKINQEEVA